MSSSELRVLETNHVPSAAFSADAAVMTQKEKMIEQIAKITIENLAGLFVVAAIMANDRSSLFHLCAEMHRQNFLAQAAKIRDSQNGVKSLGSHLANVGGAVATGLAGEEGLKMKAAGGAVSAAGSFLSSSHQAENTYDSARQQEKQQVLGNYYGDISRAQGQADQLLRTRAEVFAAMQQVLASMAR